MKNNVTIIGANSLLAQELIKDLIARNFSVTACDFSPPPPWIKTMEQSSCCWVELDLKNIAEWEKVIPFLGTLYYLPHQSLITQNYFEIEQINSILLITHWISIFCRKCSVSKVIYLSSMLNKEHSKQSMLYHRLEIENILKESQVPTIAIRLPMLLMNGAEPFEFIKNILKSFPFSFFPTWVEKQVQPIYWKDVIEILIQLLLDHSYTKVHRNINLPGPDLMSYRSLIQLIIRKQKLRRKVILNSLFSLSLMTFLYSLFSSYSRKRISDFFNSWNQDAVALVSDWKQKKSWMNVEDSLKYLQKEDLNVIATTSNIESNTLLVFKSNYITQINANQLALEFFYWLQNFCLNMIRVEIKDSSWKIYFPQKLILLRHFKVVFKSDDEISFKCLPGISNKAFTEFNFNVNICHARSRKFALISFGGNSRPFGCLTRLILKIVMKRFMKFLSL